MRLDQIDVLDDGRIILVLHDGGLPRGMSTHEAKQFGYDRMFGSLLEELKQIQKDDCPDKAYLLNLAVRTVRTSLEVLG